MKLFDELHDNNQTIIIVTHEAEIASHCHRIIRLADGKVADDHFNTRTNELMAPAEVQESHL